MIQKDEESKQSTEGIKVCGIDASGCPYSIFKKIKIDQKPDADAFKVILEFQGHYNEPMLTVDCSKNLLRSLPGKSSRVNMIYNP